MPVRAVAVATADLPLYARRQLSCRERAGSSSPRPRVRQLPHRRAGSREACNRSVTCLPGPDVFVTTTYLADLGLYVRDRRA